MYYSLSSTTRDGDVKAIISPEMSNILIKKSKSYRAQDFLKSIKDDNLWVSCSCRENALLYPRKMGDFLTLVRMPSRGDHADDCHYSELNNEIRRVKFAKELSGNRLSFHREKIEASGITSKPNITVKSTPSEVSILGRYLLTVYQKAHQNYVPLVGERTPLKDQYHAIRQILANYEIAGKKGRDVIFTHPSDYNKAVAMLYKESWHEKQVPQVLLFFTVDAIADKQLRIKIGGETINLDVQSKIEYVFDDSSPPYNCLMTLALRDTSPEPEILKCVAVPIINKAWLLPVKNDVVRQFTYKMLERGRKMVDPDKELMRYSLLTPFFPKEIDGVKFRPDFYIDRDGAGYVAIYFQSKRNDINYESRVSEMEYLMSIDVRVEVFDLDVLYTDLSRALDVFVGRVYSKHLSYFENEALNVSGYG